MKILKLVLKYKWYDLIESGVKIEEYRTMNGYWLKRLVSCGIVYGAKDLLPLDQWLVSQFEHYDRVQFYRGYSMNRKTMILGCKGIDIGEAVPEWSDNWEGLVFRIKLGKIISKTN